MTVRGMPPQQLGDRNGRHSRTDTRTGIRTVGGQRKVRGSEMDFWLQAEREIKEGKPGDASPTKPVPEQGS